LIAAQVASLTRTDRTQPSSKASKASECSWMIAPTLPPGLLGVEVGAPTVPNRKVASVISLYLKVVGILTANGCEYIELREY
jgi:hypothetical protein